MNKIIIALLTMLLLTSLTAYSFSIPSSDGNAQLNVQVSSSNEESKKEEVKEKVEGIDETKIELKEGVVFENDYITFSFNSHELNNREENDLMLLNFHSTNKQGKYLSVFISAKSINDIPTMDGSGGASTERERTPQLSIHKPKNEDKNKIFN